MKRISNPLFFILGIMFLFFSFGHAYFGHLEVIPFTDQSNLTQEVKTSVFYSWHLATGSNLLFGIFFIIMGMSRNFSGTILIGWLIFAINASRILIFMGSTSILNPENIGSTIPQLISVAIILLLIYLGIKKAKRMDSSNVSTE